MIPLKVNPCPNLGLGLIFTGSQTRSFPSVQEVRVGSNQEAVHNANKICNLQS